MNTKSYVIIWLIAALFLFFSSCSPGDGPSKSTCYGTTARGRLKAGVKLPGSGSNFSSYSALCSLLGRTYVHTRVRGVVLKAYKSLERSHPDKIFVYGETGLKNGGKFRPHKTHQNGLSVDFMVPVTDKRKNSVPLPTSIFNKFGYSLEFDKMGKRKNLLIDFEAMGAHLTALNRESAKAGISIKRVIFDPGLQRRLFKTKHGAYLKKHITFSKRGSWVRHDEHYHVDFRVRCKRL